MKKTTISVAVEQEKLRAIQFYMGKNETSLEAELGEFMAKLYKRYVPSQTREYIESMDDPENRSRPGPIGSPNLLARMWARRVSNGEFYLC